MTAGAQILTGPGALLRDQPPPALTIQEISVLLTVARLEVAGGVGLHALQREVLRDAVAKLERMLEAARQRPTGEHEKP